MATFICMERDRQEGETTNHGVRENITEEQMAKEAKEFYADFVDCDPNDGRPQTNSGEEVKDWTVVKHGSKYGPYTFYPVPVKENICFPDDEIATGYVLYFVEQ